MLKPYGIFCTLLRFLLVVIHIIQINCTQICFKVKFDYLKIKNRNYLIQHLKAD